MKKRKREEEKTVERTTTSMMVAITDEGSLRSHTGEMRESEAKTFQLDEFKMMDNARREHSRALSASRYQFIGQQLD